MSDLRSLSLHQLVKELRELEDAFADELSRNADRSSLNLLWQRIKDLTAELEKRSNAL